MQLLIKISSWKPLQTIQLIWRLAKCCVSTWISEQAEASKYFANFHYENYCSNSNPSLKSSKACSKHLTELWLVLEASSSNKSNVGKSYAQLYPLGIYLLETSPSRTRSSITASWPLNLQLRVLEQRLRSHDDWKRFRSVQFSGTKTEIE